VSADHAAMTVTVTPEPTPEELAAIVAAVTAALNGRRAAGPVSTLKSPRPSRWAHQGRLDAMRGLDDEGLDRRQLLARAP